MLLFRKFSIFRTSFGMFSSRCLNLHSKKYTNQEIEVYLASWVHARVQQNHIKKEELEPPEVLVGLDMRNFRLWLESQFERHKTTNVLMDWDNRGDCWHIDHILGFTFFNVAIPEHRLRVSHFTNLRPLWCGLNHTRPKNGDLWTMSQVCENACKFIKFFYEDYIIPKRAKVDVPLLPSISSSSSSSTLNVSDPYKGNASFLRLKHSRQQKLLKTKENYLQNLHHQEASDFYAIKFVLRKYGLLAPSGRKLIIGFN